MVASCNGMIPSPGPTPTSCSGMIPPPRTTVESREMIPVPGPTLASLLDPQVKYKMLIKQCTNITFDL